MSGILLCRSHAVSEPYYVEELGLSLYSEEELSYYIYHNATLIEEDFLDERLYRFIGTELGMTDLERKLRKWQEQAELSELLLVILQDIHYYDSDELFHFREKLSALAKKSPAARMKEKGDALFAAGRYAAAAAIYDRLLASPGIGRADKLFVGAVWYNNGMALARQYLWQQAASCLTQACALTGSEEYKKKYYWITRMAPETADAEVLRGISPDTAARWEKEWKTARENARFSGKAQQAITWLDKDNIRRAAGLTELVEEWKKEYRRSIGG